MADKLITVKSPSGVEAQVDAERVQMYLDAGFEKVGGAKKAPTVDQPPTQDELPPPPGSVPVEGGEVTEPTRPPAGPAKNAKE